MDQMTYTAGVLCGEHGGLGYTHFLHHLHRNLRPRTYFEIGTEKGASVEFVTCDSVCVDPDFKLDRDVVSNKPSIHFFQMGSDEFFRDKDLRAYFPDGPDICFLDGMHRYEYLLRDFYNTERICRVNSIIFLHDCLPLNARMAMRVHVAGPEEEGHTRHAWTGDVWKVVAVIKRHRPDLRVLFFDCPPTGLVAVTNLDPQNATLREKYRYIVDEFRDLTLESYGLNELWTAFPMIDSKALHTNGHDVTTFLNVF